VISPVMMMACTYDRTVGFVVVHVLRMDLLVVLNHCRCWKSLLIAVVVVVVVRLADYPMAVAVAALATVVVVVVVAAAPRRDPLESSSDHHYCWMWQLLGVPLVALVRLAADVVVVAAAVFVVPRMDLWVSSPLPMKTAVAADLDSSADSDSDPAVVSDVPQTDPWAP